MSETESFIVVIDGGSRRGKTVEEVVEGRRWITGGCNNRATAAVQESCGWIYGWFVAAVDLLLEEMITYQRTSRNYVPNGYPVELFQLRTASLYGGTNNIFSLLQRNQ